MSPNGSTACLQGAPSKRNVGPHLIIIAGIFRKDPSKVRRVDTIKWSVHSRRIELIKRSTYPILPGRAE